MSTPKPPMPARCRNFNDTMGAMGYMTAHGPAGGNRHPDRCKCQGNDTTPHKHYDDFPYSCARCMKCKAYDPALPDPAIRRKRVAGIVASYVTSHAERDALMAELSAEFGL